MVLNPSLDDAFPPIAGDDASGRRPGWLISLTLHGLAAFFLIHQLSELPLASVPALPVDLVQLAEQTVIAAPAPEPAAPAPRTASVQPPAAPVQAAPVVPAIPNPPAELPTEALPQDELETKLAALAKLRQPQTGAVAGLGTAGTG